MDPALATTLSSWIRQQHWGVLSTHSLRHPNYPFGSSLPYFVSSSQHITFYMSDLAEHTKHIKADSHVAFTISEAMSADSPGSEARLTCLGDLVVSDKQSTLRQEYLSHFTDNDTILSLPGFHFYEMRLIEIRVIAGFGKISWISPQSLDLN